MHVLSRSVLGKQASWTMLAQTEADVPAIRLGREVELSVRARGRKLTVSIAGKPVIQTDLPGALSGRYGVGGPFANHVAWRKVRLR